MPNTTASNKPLLAAAAATPTCSVLERLRANSFDQLMARAIIVYEGALDQLQATSLSIMNERSSDTLEHKLAESIYFRDGHNLIIQYRIADTTRLQQEHEAVVVGIGSQEEVGQMSDLTLRLHLSAWVSALNADREAQTDRDNSNHQENIDFCDDGYESGDPSEGGNSSYELSPTILP